MTEVMFCIVATICLLQCLVLHVGCLCADLCVLGLPALKTMWHFTWKSPVFN